MNNTISIGGCITRDGHIQNQSSNNFVSVASSKHHSLGLTTDGRVVGWGYNEFGQINCPSIQASLHEPQKYKDLRFIAIAAGYLHSLTLTNDGRVVGWGDNSDDQRDLPEEYKDLRFAAVSAGTYHSLALTRDGRVIGWGYNDASSIRGKRIASLPKQLSQPCTPPNETNFIAIAAGAIHSLALTRDGRVVGWGGNYDGQINCPHEAHYVAIAAGQNHSLALTKDGRVVGWGWNRYEQINCPKENHFVAISASGHTSLALTNNGKVVVWGDNENLDFKEKTAMPYDFLTRLNSGLKVISLMPKYIKMEILEDYTGWTFGNLFYL